MQPLLNHTFKPGVENTVYNALVRALSAGGAVVLVRTMEDADAILTGVVETATYGGIGGTTVSSLKPDNLGSQLNAPIPGFSINSAYSASLGCSFVLTRCHPHEGTKGVVWSAGFSKSKPFPSANQLDVPGTTSPLINESEFERALVDMARTMMDDVNNSMTAMF